MWDATLRAGLCRLLAWLIPGVVLAAEPVNPRYSGSPIIRTWTGEDYGAHPESRAVLQHPRTGFMYVGNNAGVLEFDGVRWHLIPLAGGGAVRTLAVDALGRVWAGGPGEISVLVPDARGELRAESAQARLPPFKLPLMGVFDSFAADGGVYLRDQHRLAFFGDDGGPARVWRLGDGTNNTPVIGLRMWAMDGRPHVLIGGDVAVVGPPVVSRLGANGLEQVPGLGFGVLAVRPLPGGGAELLSEEGLERWDGTRATTVSHPLGDDTAQAAAWLADGRIVFGTRRSGIILCDGEGRVLQRIDRARGLPGNSVFALCEDREGGLWATFRSGLARIQLDSPYALHGPAQGLEGTVQSLARRGDELFAGGSEGVARRGARGQFEPLAGVPGGIREVMVHGDRLFMLGQRLFELGPAPGDRVRELENRNYFGLLPCAGAPGWFFYGANQGVRWAHADGGTWVHDVAWCVNAIQGLTYALIEEPTGILWAAGASGLWRIDFRAGLRQEAPARRFGPDDGIPAVTSAQLFRLGGSLVALAQGYCYRYDETAARFFPETRITAPALAAGGIANVHVDEAGTIWLQAAAPGREIHRLVADGPGRWRAELLPGPALGHLLPTALFHDPATRTLWVAGFGALVSRDLDWRSAHEPPAPAAVVRRIETAAGEVLRSGSLSGPGNATAGWAALSLVPAQDALRLSFAAPSYQTDHLGASHTAYRTRLDGLDTEWSEWSAQSQRDFTNLPWRAFTFRVQARDDAGRIGPEAVFAFAIAPPWWATRWAWGGYALLAGLGIAGIVKLRTRTLLRQRTRLEGVVAERTRELAASNTALAAQNSELARLNRLELEEKISAQLAEEKARLEMLRYQLNPHFLYNALNSIYGLALSAPQAAADMTLRLADFCRVALVRSEGDRVTLGAEFDGLGAYFEVEKARWGDALRIEIEAGAEARAARIPPFLLLPLVENAIKYGGATSPAELTVRLSARCERGALIIEVANTGTWMAPASGPAAGVRPAGLASTGIGLANLRQRLARYYPGAHEFTTEAKGGWVVARLFLARFQADEP